MTEAPHSVRLGGLALLLDGIAAAAAMLLAYLLRFEGAGSVLFLQPALPLLTLVVAVQIGVAFLLGLYRHEGQRMWPLRLMTGAVAGAGVMALLAPWLGLEAGVSRQALGGQTCMFALLGMIWRAVEGLQYRGRRERAVRARYGSDVLVVQGEDLSSMTGGVLRAWGYRHLLYNLVAKDLQLKYRGSVLGFAWSILIPLMMIGVYTVAFTYVMGVATPRFVLYLLVGLLAWNFFAGALAGATEAISGGGALLKSVVFPRAVLPFAVVLFHLSQYVLTLTVFLPLMLILYRVSPSPLMLLFPVFLALQVLFVTGLALALSAATALLRDVRHLVDIGLGMLFWATPIIYEMKRVPEPFQFLALLSPAAPFIRAYQDIFYYGVVPDPTIWVVAVAYAFGAFVCGLSVFLAYEGSFSELV